MLLLGKFNKSDEKTTEQKKTRNRNVQHSIEMFRNVLRGFIVRLINCCELFGGTLGIPCYSLVSAVHGLSFSVYMFGITTK